MANGVLVQDVERVVRQRGFVPVRIRTDELLIISIERALEMFGENCSKALLYQLCTMHKMSHEELLSRYDLIEKSLRTVFGFGAEAIITFIRANFLKNLGVPDSGQALLDLLKQSKERGCRVFVAPPREGARGAGLFRRQACRKAGRRVPWIRRGL